MDIGRDIIHSLYQCKEYPLELSQQLCKEYAMLKLGVSSSVQYFAEMLLPSVEAILENKPEYTSWVLTAPPSRQLPTAAILLSSRLYEMLQRKYPEEGQLSLVHLWNNREEGSVHENAREFSHFSGYSRYTWAERMALIRKNQFSILEEDFCKRGIVFINDINVTGASQAHISEAFAAVVSDKVHWQYIIDCDKTMGRENPHLENELNNTGINTVSDFGAILASKGMRHTAKCISKVFSYNSGELEQLLGMLNPLQRTKLWEAIQMEDLFKGDVFEAKMALLKRLCKSSKK